MVATEDWRASPQRWDLVLEEGGPVYGSILPARDGVASIALLGRARAEARFEGRVLRLDTLAAPVSVKLFTATSVTFAEVVHTVGPRALRWATTVSPREVDLTLSFRPWGGAEQVLTSRVACSALQLAPASHDQGAFVDLSHGFGRMIVGEEPLEVHAAPDGPVAFTVPAPRRFVEVAVVGAEGPMRRVASTIAPDVWLVGWVHQERLAPLQGGHGVGCGVGHGRLARRGWSHTTRCTKRLPLYVELEGARKEVGDLMTGAAFHQRGPRDGGFTAITPEDSDVRLREGATWLVPDEPLRAHCTRR